MPTKNLEACKIFCFFLQSVGSLTFVPRTTVYMWGNGTTLPLVLPSPSDSRVVGVACGRSQKAGVTEDGKLFLWQVGRCISFVSPLSLSIFSLLSLSLSLSVFSISSQCCCHDTGTTPKKPRPDPPRDDNQINYRRILSLYQEGFQWRHVLRLPNRFENLFVCVVCFITLLPIR